MLRVAVVGSGPAGAYTAAALTSHDEVAVDVLDRLPCPFGLVRYGVAPDHPKIQSISLTLAKILGDPAVRFLGNVEVGGDRLPLAELHRHYDAVVFAHGAAIDRRLRVPGEDLPGSHSATEFVAWYGGHPDSPRDAFTLDAESVAVIGVGNVALDVTRMLARSADDLRATDIPDHVLVALEHSRVRDIHLVGRRGPAQVKFTTKELRELGEVANADVLVDPSEAAVSEEVRAALPKPAQRNLDVLQGWAERVPEGRPRRVHLRFFLSPVEVLGGSQVSGLRLERTTVDEAGHATPTGRTCTVDAELVLRSVGYRGVAMPGLPFDEDTGVVPHEAGRVLRDGEPAPGEYVAGWIKRGPTGVIGTNKQDANETVGSLFEDAPCLPRAPVRDPEAVVALCEERGMPVVTWQGWRAIELAEAALGRTQGRERAKIAVREELLRAAARTAG
ncbi:MAG: FAD-dependent oxidoreductase [Actinomycetes bacterium]